MSDDTHVAIVEIERQVEKCRATLLDLETRRREIDMELPRMKANLDALERTLLIIRGTSETIIADKQPVVKSTPPVLDSASIIKDGSMTTLACSILKEAGEPLKMRDIFDRAKMRRPEIGKPSFQSGIYRLMKDNKVFNKCGEKIGLIEWGRAMSASPTQGKLI